MKPGAFILHLPLVIVGLAAITSLLSFRLNYPRSMKMFSMLLVINFFMDFAGHIISSLGYGTHWLYNINFTLLYIFIPALYKQEIDSPVIARLVKLFWLVLGALFLYLSLQQGIGKLLSPVVVLGGSFIIFLATVYFRQLYLSEDNDPLIKNPWFWFSVGLLINYGGTVPFFGMFNYLLGSNGKFASDYYFYFANSCVILLHLMIIAGYLCRINRQKSRLL